MKYIIVLGFLLSWLRTTTCHAVSGQLYSSLTHMYDLFVFDKMVEDLLPFLPPYIPEVQRYSEDRIVLRLDAAKISAGDPLGVAITGNPLHLYSVLKRLVVYWPIIRKTITIQTSGEYNCIDGHEDCNFWSKWGECENNPIFMKTHCQLSCGLCGDQDIRSSIELLQDMEEVVVLPSANDLRGASLALARLQQIYRLNIPDLAEGKIGHVTTGVRLNVYDCMLIAKESQSEGEYANAYLWYKYAIAISKDPELKHHIQSFMNQVADEHDAKFTDDIVQFFPKPLAGTPNQIPWDTKYAQLCRGQTFMDQRTRSDMKCYVSSRGSPYLFLQPAKYEQLHNNPEMYLFHDVISDNEIMDVQDTASDSLARSMVISTTNPVEVRVSQTAWLYNNSHPVLPRLAKRISVITGLLVHEDTNDNMAGEAIQVLSYGIGGHYTYHMDPMWKHDVEENWESYREKFNHFDSGDRIATWMFYLSEVEAGGRTAFPKAGIAVEPVKGAAVFWFSIKKNGQGNPQSEHGGCPVLLGHKWVANKWIREHHNYLRRPCSLNEQD